ncbi:hypothetical protein HUN01_33680 [Nostoc edaphicum CCNP1411]|uniref:Uncharacterized protein n=1 Tax=Nostoc edaphicum CCNP1411 TaxID=1472755 RepID=A0A7D7QN54_9NOSO|nr:hypothetical protein [Nostoc edaphicum]QMS92301.1 hypothetical protein HUN01_33680 [Nostoc edaphicum CCNP1411]
MKPSFYPIPGWLWQYPKPKPSTSNANSAMLLIVELFHYLTYLTQLGVAYSFYYYRDFYQPSCGAFFFVVMAPIFQQIAGSFPMLMHEYEGWQIAECKDSGCEPEKYNNDQLRYVTYKLLFLFQAIAAGMYTIGVLGFDKWQLVFLEIDKPWTVILIITILLWLYILPRDTKPFPKKLNGQDIFPVPFLTFLSFIPLTLSFTASLIYLMGGWSALFPGLLVSALYLGGGLSEGLGAESTFNQWWHLLAVVLLNAGGGMLILFITRHAIGLL